MNRQKILPGASATAVWVATWALAVWLIANRWLQALVLIAGLIAAYVIHGRLSEMLRKRQ